MTPGSKPFRLRRGPTRITPVGAAERRAGYGVLAVLLAVAAFFLVRQSTFNPAVVAALSASQAAQTSKKAGQAGAELAGLIESLPGVSPLSEIEGFGPDTLSDKIDGKAELYLSSGFKEMACRAFGPQGGLKARFDVYVYEMASKDSAFAVFSGQRRTGAARSELTENAYTTANALFFASGPYYVEVVADSDAEPVRALLAPMGQALQAKLTALGGGQAGAGAPGDLAASDFFPKAGQVADSLRLSKADAFGLEGFGDVYTADYKLGEAEATGFVCLLPDPEQATAWRQKYLKFLTDNGYVAVQAGSAPEGAALLEMAGAFEAVLTRGRLLYGVHEATGRQAALDLAGALDGLAREKLR